MFVEAAVGHIEKFQEWVCQISEALAAPVAGQEDTVTHMLTGRDPGVPVVSQPQSLCV